MTNTKTNKPQETAAAPDTSRDVVPAQAISINVEGGMIRGTFIKSMTRTSKAGEDYRGHVFEATAVICEGRQDKKPLPLVAGRYFVFGATRLDRLMSEVERGESVKVSYLGKVKNEKPGDDGTYGVHHAFRVTYID